MIFLFFFQDNPSVSKAGVSPSPSRHQEQLLITRTSQQNRCYTPAFQRQRPRHSNEKVPDECPAVLKRQTAAAMVSPEPVCATAGGHVLALACTSSRLPAEDRLTFCCSSNTVNESDFISEVQQSQRLSAWIRVSWRTC